MRKASSGPKKTRIMGPPCPFRIDEEPDVQFKPYVRVPLRGYYRRALDELYETGGVLAFASSRPLAQIKKAAKKAGYVLGFALRGDELLVRIEDRLEVLA